MTEASEAGIKRRVALHKAAILSLWLGGAAFALDRLHKYLQIEVFGWRGGEHVSLTPFFDYVLVWNPGISYSLLQSAPPLALLALMGAAILLLAFWWLRAETALAKFGLAICIGGALSHVVDRITYGAVPDFFYPHWQAWSFYVFNISDTAITCGVILLLVDTVRPRRNAEV